MKHLKKYALHFAQFVVVLTVIAYAGMTLTTSTGCSALPGILTAIDYAITDSDQALKIVETTFNLFNGDHPVSPEVKATFEKLLATAYSTLKTGAKIVHDGQAVDQGQYDAAFADFKVAFLALTDYLKSEGITPVGAGLVGVGPNGGKDFPEPAIIGLKLKS